MDFVDSNTFHVSNSLCLGLNWLSVQAGDGGEAAGPGNEVGIVLRRHLQHGRLEPSLAGFRTSSEQSSLTVVENDDDDVMIIHPGEEKL